MVEAAEEERGWWSTPIPPEGGDPMRSCADERERAFVRWCAGAAIDGFRMSTETEPLMTLMELFERRAARRRRP